MSTRISILFCAFLHFLAAVSGETVAANPFEKEIAAYKAADKAAPPPQGSVLFTGASGIRLWKTLAQDFPVSR